MKLHLMMRKPCSRQVQELHKVTSSTAARPRLEPDSSSGLGSNRHSMMAFASSTVNIYHFSTEWKPLQTASQGREMEPGYWDFISHHVVYHLIV